MTPVSFWPLRSGRSDLYLSSISALAGIEVTMSRLFGEDVVVRRVDLLVDLEGDLVDLAGPVALVVGVLRENDRLLLVPGVELVRAGADRLVAEGLGVGEERVREGRERGVAQTDREVRDLLGGLDREGVVVDHRETGQLVGLGLAGAGARVVAVTGALEVAEALDRLEEVPVVHAVRRVRGVVPRVDEVLRLDLGAVVELQALLELDREVLVVRRVDGLGLVVLGLGGLGVVVDELREDLRSSTSPPQVSPVFCGTSGFCGLQP